MSRSVLITISEATFARLMRDAVASGARLEKHLANILTTEASTRDDADRDGHIAAKRNADPPRLRHTRLVPRRGPVNFAAIDAAIARTGEALRRRNGNLTAALMGDPEPGRAKR